MKAVALFLCLLGMLCVVWAGVSWTNGTWSDPMDYFNLVGGIAVSVCGVGLLAGRGTQINRLDSITLSSIGMTQSSIDVAVMAAPPKLSGGKSGTSESDSVPKATRVKKIGGIAARPISSSRKTDKRVESLIETASSLLTRESP